MSIKIGWIDFYEDERKEINKILSQLGSSDLILDELGFGSVRDGFRKELFPGVVMPMTHLRYYFFIYYIFLEIKDLKKFFKQKNYYDTLKKTKVKKFKLK